MKQSFPILIGLIGFLAFSASAQETATKKKPTPPTVVDTWNLKQDFAKIDQQWQSIFEVLENEEYFAIANEEISKWSCGKQAGHLALVQTFFGKTIQECLDKPLANQNEKTSPQAEMILRSGIIPRGAGKAPETVKPGEKSREELLKILRASHKQWQELSKKQQAIANSQAHTQHPVLGWFKASDWVRFAAIHNAHHLKIVRDILKAAGAKKKGFGKALFVKEKAKAGS